MKKFKLLIPLLLFLAIITGALMAWRILNPPKKTPPSPIPTPTIESKFPIPTPTFFKKEQGESPEELLKNLKQKFPLIEYLPYETEKFSINYQAPFSLKIKIKKTEELEIIKKEVLNWIQSKGVDPTTHQIEWLTPEP